ncbi:MAG: ribosomal protein S18-alanine N-acetyltransferase [Ruminococcus sp.]|nr:ribosomal protein S18-alanine N-acetyltransferase [Ruminococcus sp.]
MIIENMSAEHLSSVLKIEEESFSNGWSEQSFCDELKKENSYKFVAVENDEVLGYCVLETVLDEGNLLDIAVSQKHRRKGIAKKLFEKMFEVAYSKKLSFITLEVRESSIPAISLYKALGFETVAVRKNYYSKPTENAVLMTKYFNL